jgi:hypothetical protein
MWLSCVSLETQILYFAQDDRLLSYELQIQDTRVFEEARIEKHQVGLRGPGRAGFDTINGVPVNHTALSRIFHPPSAVRIARFLALATLLAFRSNVSRAQFVTSLSPSLTTDAETAPVTTLSPDLLTPQRTFTYDATGAGIFANALTPEVNASVLNSAAETDTAVRDSSQAGQSSPYFQSAGRLGISFTGDRGSAASAFSSTGSGVASASNGGFGTGVGGGRLPTGEDFDRGDQGETNSAYHSTWGSGTPAGSVSDDGSVPPVTIGDYQPDDSLSASRSSRDRGQDRLLRENLAFGSSRSLGEKTSLVSRYSASGVATGLAMSRSSVVSGLTSDVPLRRSAQSAQAGVQPSAAAAETIENVLSFSPGSYAGYTFGASPFSPPRSGDLTFLNPNIFAIRPVRLASNQQRTARDRQAQRQRLEQPGELSPLASPRLSEGALPSSLEQDSPRIGGDFRQGTLQGGKRP